MELNPRTAATMGLSHILLKQQDPKFLTLISKSGLRKARPWSLSALISQPSKLAQGPLPNPGQQQTRATRAALLVSLNHVHPWETGSENIRGYQSTWCPEVLRGPRLPALLCCASPQGQTLLSPQPGLCRAGPAAPGALLQLNGSTGSFHPPWAEPHHCRALTESRGQLPSCAPAATTPGKAQSGAGSELRRRAVAAAYSMQLQLGVKKHLQGNW